MEESKFMKQELEAAQAYTDSCYNFGGTVLAACKHDFVKATNLLNEYAQKLADEPEFINFLENFKGLDDADALALFG